MADHVHLAAQGWLGRSGPLGRLGLLGLESWLRSTWPSYSVISLGDSESRIRSSSLSGLPPDPELLYSVHVNAEAHSSIYIYIYTCVYTYIYIYIYTYRQRERERERE